MSGAVAPSRAKRLTPKGRRVREAVLDAAIEIAIPDGLEAVTFGRLAKQLGISKSGLFSHFATKLELQLAAVDHAEQRFVTQVFRAEFLQAPRGLPRLWALCDGWLLYAQAVAAEGGCFFQALVAEYHNRPGPLRDRAKGTVETFNASLQRAITDAKTAGHLRDDVPTERFAFELHSLMGGANGGFQLFGDPGVFSLCRDCLRERIEAFRTETAPPLPNREG